MIPTRITLRKKSLTYGTLKLARDGEEGVEYVRINSIQGLIDFMKSTKARLYNPFESDNQSEGYSRVCASLAKLEGSDHEQS